MRSIYLFSIGLLLFFAQTTSGRPIEKKDLPTLVSNPSPWVHFPAAPNKSAVDTTYIMGGPDRWDGSFDSPDGQPDWHGWTHVDRTQTLVNHWHVSEY